MILFFVSDTFAVALSQLVHGLYKKCLLVQKQRGSKPSVLYKATLPQLKGIEPSEDSLAQSLRLASISAIILSVTAQSSADRAASSAASAATAAASDAFLAQAAASAAHLARSASRFAAAAEGTGFVRAGPCD